MQSGAKRSVAGAPQQVRTALRLVSCSTAGLSQSGAKRRVGRRRRPSNRCTCCRAARSAALLGRRRRPSNRFTCCRAARSEALLGRRNRCGPRCGLSPVRPSTRKSAGRLAALRRPSNRCGGAVCPALPCVLCAEGCLSCPALPAPVRREAPRRWGAVSFGCECAAPQAHCAERREAPRCWGAAGALVLFSGAGSAA